MRLTVIAFGLVLLCGVGFAAETSPTSAPAPAPWRAATMLPAPNWSTPKDAYLTYSRAYAVQDGLTMQKSVAWENASDGERAAHLSQAAAAMNAGAAAYDLLLQKFPDDALVKETVKQARFLVESMEKLIAQNLATFEKRVTDIEVKIEGDNATLIAMKSTAMTFKLKKVDGRWLLLPESLGMPVVPEDEEMRKEMAASDAMSMRIYALKREGYAAFVTDLKAGKYATGKEAAEAMQKIDQDVFKKAAAEKDLDK